MIVVGFHISTISHMYKGGKEDSPLLNNRRFVNNVYHRC